MKDAPEKKTPANNILLLKEEKIKNTVVKSNPASIENDSTKQDHEIEEQQKEQDLLIEELKEAQIAVQDAIDLSDFAPMGYFTLSGTGEIIGLNLSGARMLQEERSFLKGKHFEHFVTNKTKSIFNNFLQGINLKNSKETCEVTLSNDSGNSTKVLLTGTLSKNKEHYLITSINISERKQIETTLQYERELYLDLVNNQSAGIYRIRVFQKGKWWRNAWYSSEKPPYCMEYASDRFCEILGITLEDFEANPGIIIDLIYPDDKQDFVTKNENSNTDILPFKWDGRLVINQKIRWIHLESLPRQIENNEVVWTGILYDTTYQKQAEETIIESENKYRELVDNSPDAIAIYSEGKIVFVNNECLRLMAASAKDELIGKPVIEFIHPDYRSKIYERMAKVIHDRSVQPLTEEQFIRLDGTTVDVVVKSLPIIFQNRDAVQLIVRDNTSQKIIEKELRESRENFRDLFDNAPVGYHEINTEGRIVRMNQTELTMLGYTPEEIIGQYIWKIAHNETETRQQVKDKLQGRNISLTSFETILISKTGIKFSILILDKILYDVHGNITGIRSTIQDISEIKKAEKELNESREEYRELFEYAPVGYHEIDNQGKIVRMNQTELKMLGYISEELIGKYCWELSAHKDFSRKVTIEKLNGNKLSSIPYERILVRKDGRKIPILEQDKIIRSDDGSITGIRTSVHDITERKKVDEELKISEEKFRNIFQNSNIGKSMTTFDGKMIANKAFSEIVGYSIAELAQLNWTEFTHKDDIDYNKKIINSIQKGEITFSHWEKRYIHKSGKIVWVDISTFLMKDNEGNPENFITEIYDITERKEAEASLRESEEHYRNLVTRIPDGVYKSSHKGKFIDVNPAMVKMLGYESKEELMAINIKTQLYFNPDDRESLILKEKNEEIGVYQLKRKDGSGIWIEDHGWYNTDIQGEVISHEGVLRDITLRKLSEEALMESKVVLNKLLYSTTEFIDSNYNGIDYTKLTDIILDISGAKYATYNSLNESNLEYTTLAVSGLSKNILLAKKMLGFELNNKTFKLDAVKHKKISSTTITRFKGVSDLAENILPVALSKLIEKTFNIGETCVVKITKKDKIIGDFTLLFNKGITLKNIEILELFATQAGLFIDRDKTDKELRANEEKYRYLFDNNPQPMYIHDIDTLAFLEVNKAAIEHYGYSKDEFMRMNLKDIRPTEDIPSLLIDVKDSRNTFKPSGVWRHKKKNGEIIFVDITTVSVISGGKIVRHVMIQDITERKRSETALKESISLLNATIESTADGILVVDHNGKITLYNQKFVDMWNIPTEILKSKDDEPVLYSVINQVKSQDDFLNKIRYLYANPTLISNDLIELKNGHIIDRYSLPHKIGESIVGRVWSFRDITQSKMAEEALRVNEVKFRSITEQIDDVITITDGKGTITYTSPASRDLFQYEPEEMTGHHFTEYFAEESLPLAIAAFNEGIELKKKAIDIELKLKRKDGSVFYGEINGSEFMNGDERGSLVVVHDITNRKETLELLKESEEKFRSIAEQTSDMISIADTYGFIKYASKASTSIFQFEPEEMCGRNFTDFVEENSISGARDLFENCMKAGESFYGQEFKMKKKDGTLFCGEINGSAFKYGNNSGTLVIIRDISDRKKAQDALQEKMNELMRFHNLTVGRELTMIELKKEINKLLKDSGHNEKYNIVE